MAARSHRMAEDGSAGDAQHDAGRILDQEGRAQTRRHQMRVLIHGQHRQPRRSGVESR